MDEKQLIEACLQGNMEDFRVIVEKYSAPAMAMAMNILGNRADAEDACQEAFIQVFRNLARFDVKRSFKSWLYAILYRRCLDQLRRRRRSFGLVKKMQLEALPAKTRNPDPLPEDKSLPSRLLDHLRPKERIVLSLWANEGYTAQEISEVLRCSSSTARVYLFQARKKIKSLLEKKDVSLPDY
jgi:RNA polymerase sigma-70 factor (ECF subfamily)